MSHEKGGVNFERGVGFKQSDFIKSSLAGYWNRQVGVGMPKRW